jgi:hypothetical protein
LTPASDGSQVRLLPGCESTGDCLKAVQRQQPVASAGVLHWRLILAEQSYITASMHRYTMGCSAAIRLINNNYMEKPKFKEKEKEAVDYIKIYCHSEDIEGNHLDADRKLRDFLLELGYNYLVNEWDKVNKWYA